MFVHHTSAEHDILDDLITLKVEEHFGPEEAKRFTDLLDSRTTREEDDTLLQRDRERRLLKASNRLAVLKARVERDEYKSPRSRKAREVSDARVNFPGNPTESEFDAFIAHASEDKEAFVGPLARVLSEHIRVWYDEISLTVGDSLRRKIDQGLAKSRYGIVVLSHNFFRKEWPQKELDGLVTKERHGTKVILPVWLDVDHDDVARYSPLLADRVAAKAKDGLEVVVSDLRRAIEVGGGDKAALEVDEVENVNVNPLQGAVDAQRQAAAAFRFELESNLAWLHNITESRNYLRDDAWVKMKNEGHVSYLPYPIPNKVIDVYERLHAVNQQIRLLREMDDPLESEELMGEVSLAGKDLGKEIKELLTMLDETYPEIARNFRGR